MKEIEVKNVYEIPGKFTGVANILKNKLWYKDGLLHRQNAPAVEEDNGNKFWYKNGEFHRIDGPAIKYTDGNGEHWFKNGKRHRLDGPARVTPDGIESFWINGTEHSEEDYNKKTKLIQQQLPKRYTDYKHLTDKQWYEYLNILVLK